MITKPTAKLMLMAGAFLLFALTMVFPMDAFAQSNVSAEQITQNLGKNIATVPKLIALAAYVIGAFFAVRALFALKGFIEAPDDNPVTKVLGFAAVAALLIMLPFTISVMTNALMGNKNTTLDSSIQQFEKTSTF